MNDAVTFLNKQKDEIPFTSKLLMSTHEDSPAGKTKSEQYKAWFTIHCKIVPQEILAGSQHDCRE
jgi:hypothetical protein